MSSGNPGAGQIGLRIALAQVNPTVGDIVGNADLIATQAAKAHKAGVQLLVFPEMVLTGYPVEDLALRQSFRNASRIAISELAKRIANSGFGSLVMVVGYLDQIDGAIDKTNDNLGLPIGAPQNAVAIIHEGEIKARYIKHHLPNYGVFDEFRNFVPGQKSLVVRVNGVDIGIAICEDIWQNRGPVAELGERQVGLVVVPNGSPYERNKDDLRLSLVQERAKGFGAALAYVNMTGGQDELVFDGDSIIVDSHGEVLMRTKQFEEQLAIHDLELPLGTSNPDVVITEANNKVDGLMHGGIAQRKDDLAEIWEALKVGLRDYVAKNGFKTVVLGLSGGIDSALVASIAVDALGADKVFGIGLPSKYSSEHSIADAEDLARRTGLNFRIIPIEPMVHEFVANLELTGLAEENVQARVRGTTLMGLSNQEGHLVLATGNKSELAVGYSTLYGDAVGGFAPIKDIYKTQVWQLAKWRNELAIYLDQTPPIPTSSIEKEPSAELRPDQKDTDSLPDYLLLDQVLTRYVDGDEGAAALIASGFDQVLVNRVITMVDRAEYKRRQYPPGTKISNRAFGKDRRLPITSRWNER
ncbi:MAG: NAD+ synthase [Candidatus Nanopelagicaceae bacterium]